MSATAMDNVRSATPGQVRRSPSVPAHWPIRRHVAAAETTPAGPLHSVEVTVPDPPKKEESTGNAELDKMIRDGNLAISEMKRLNASMAAL